MQPSLGIVVLPWKAQVVLHNLPVAVGIFVHRRLAEGFVLRLPDLAARGVAHRLRRSQVIVVEIVHPLRRDCRNERQCYPGNRDRRQCRGSHRFAASIDREVGIAGAGQTARFGAGHPDPVSRPNS